MPARKALAATPILSPDGIVAGAHALAINAPACELGRLRCGNVQTLQFLAQHPNFGDSLNTHARTRARAHTGRTR
eukprot:4558931-Alexandrium_andersonii.AAC.1